MRICFTFDKLSHSKFVNDQIVKFTIKLQVDKSVEECNRITEYTVLKWLYDLAKYEWFWLILPKFCINSVQNLS